MLKKLEIPIKKKEDIRASFSGDRFRLRADLVENRINLQRLLGSASWLSFQVPTTKFSNSENIFFIWKYEM